MRHLPGFGLGVVVVSASRPAEHRQVSKFPLSPPFFLSLLFPMHRPALKREENDSSRGVTVSSTCLRTSSIRISFKSVSCLRSLPSNHSLPPLVQYRVLPPMELSFQKHMSDFILSSSRPKVEMWRTVCSGESAIDDIPKVYREFVLRKSMSFQVLVLNRCTTGTELGGSDPYSVITIVMYSAGVRS